MKLSNLVLGLLPLSPCNPFVHDWSAVTVEFGGVTSSVLYKSPILTLAGYLVSDQGATVAEW